MTNVNEILDANGLNFRIEKMPMFAMDLDNGVIESNYFGLLNTQSGEIINTVKKGYHVTQNEEIVSNVVKGMEQYGELSVNKAYSIKGGRRIALQLAIEGKATVNGDEIKRYVTIVDSNDGTSGLGVGIGDLTMSCQNQFYQFYKGSQIKARHTASIQGKVSQLSNMIGTALSESMKLVDLYRAFETTKVSRNLAHGLVNNLIGFDKTSDLSEVKTRGLNIMEAMYDNIHHQMNEKGENLWGLHSGITRFTTHDKSAPNRDNGRLEMMLVGNGAKMNNQSLDFAKLMM